MSFFFFLVGPAGSGKTTIGKKIKEELKFHFFDGDNFHSKSNINKMKKGISLTQRDRLPWLSRINTKLKKLNNLNRNFIIACSALKKNYRNRLARNLDNVFFLFLNCKKKELIKRTYSRKHFFNPNLIENQIMTFEKSRDLININANKKKEVVTNNVKRKIKKYLKLS
tara:strand:- start:2590 stop:3093 length:504 start_codon:yes stop_codon:yes gene_type:complete